jgi:hydroxymethylpyrimidine/phosphomethylpyrimidine kinase
MIKTFKKLSQRQGLALIFLTCLTLLSGCATLFKQPEPVTVDQVIEMSKEGVPAEAIVTKMRDSETVYRLTAAQLAKLHDVGVADPVLDYMQRTYIEEQRREQSRQDLDDWDMWGPRFW